jgi:hypothetical protein
MASQVSPHRPLSAGSSYGRPRVTSRSQQLRMRERDSHPRRGGTGARLRSRLRSAPWTTAGAVLGLLILSACGSDSSTRDSGRADSANADQPAPDRQTIERKAGMAGTLLVKPTAPTAGGTIRIAVKNAGKRAMYYGLDNQIERRVGADWRDATADVFGAADPGVRAILLSAAPGECAGPNYGNVVDRIRLPRDLKPGRYRVVKRVSGNDRGFGPPQVKLKADFEVRGP